MSQLSNFSACQEIGYGATLCLLHRRVLWPDLDMLHPCMEGMLKALEVVLHISNFAVRFAMPDRTRLACEHVCMPTTRWYATTQLT